MTRQIHRIAALATAGLAVAGLAACSSTSSTSNGPSGATPQKGGTLKIVAAGGPNYLDTVPAYYTANYILERTFARQLLSYPAAPDPKIGGPGWVKDTVPIPDIATEFPTVANHGLSSDGMTYTFHLRSGVMWGSSPPRPVVAADFVREFKAFCNPVAPVGNLPYYSQTVAGLQSYCNKETAFFAKIKNPTAAQIAKFQNTHDISGGPYNLSSYVPNRSITLVKNPVWKQSSDPVRHQYVNEITVTMGVNDAATQLADEQAGKYDMSLDVSVEPSAIPNLLTSHDPKFYIWPWISTVPYIVFNLRSPNSGHVMANLKVRQAVEYAINKVAIQKINGGPLVAKIINTAVPPGAAGYQNYNPYPSKGSQGDPAKCKALLAQAGFKNGLTKSLRDFAAEKDPVTFD